MGWKFSKTCPECGKNIKLVWRQNPDFPRGVKSLYAKDHVCKPSKTKKEER